MDDKVGSPYIPLILEVRRWVGFIAFKRTKVSCIDIEVAEVLRKCWGWSGWLDYWYNVEIEEGLSTPSTVLTDNTNQKELLLCPLSVAENGLLFTFCTIPCLHVDSPHKWSSTWKENVKLFKRWRKTGSSYITFHFRCHHRDAVVKRVGTHLSNLNHTSKNHCLSYWDAQVLKFRTERLQEV